MEHIKTINEADFKKSATGTGCGECQVSCQTASKVDKTVVNQKCEKRLQVPRKIQNNSLPEFVFWRFARRYFIIKNWKGSGRWTRKK